MCENRLIIDLSDKMFKGTVFDNMTQPLALVLLEETHNFSRAFSQALAFDEGGNRFMLLPDIQTAIILFFMDLIKAENDGRFIPNMPVVVNEQIICQCDSVEELLNTMKQVDEAFDEYFIYTDQIGSCENEIRHFARTKRLIIAVLKCAFSQAAALGYPD